MQKAFYPAGRIFAFAAMIAVMTITWGCGGDGGESESECDVTCPPGQVVTDDCGCADTATGQDDPCALVTCLPGYACQNGTCVDTSSPLKDFTETVNGAAIDMVFVQGATFAIGCNDGTASQFPPAFTDTCLASDNASPVHRVTLDSYYIGKYEVTQRQWKSVMGGDNNPSMFRDDDRPVDNVSWNDAKEFIDKLNTLTGKNYRLPTNAEWEFAARGGTKTNNYRFSGSHDVGEVAWYGLNSGGESHPVGQKKANELGIHDMSGNAFEWVNDWFETGHYRNARSQDGTPVLNPQGPATGTSRVLRGGSWATSTYPHRSCRSTDRQTSEPPDRSLQMYGFRLALSE